MERKMCHSMRAPLLVGGLSVAVVLGLIKTSPTFGVAEESPAAPVVTLNESANEQLSNELDILKPGELEKIWRVLAVFLILSAVIESALTPLFNWRVFLEHAHNKGLRTPITMVFAFLIVWGYGLDIIRDLLAALGQSVGPRISGQVLTAFLLAGGSSGVYQLLKKWHVRMSDKEREERARGVGKTGRISGGNN